MRVKRRTLAPRELRFRTGTVTERRSHPRGTSPQARFQRRPWRLDYGVCMKRTGRCGCGAIAYAFPIEAEPLAVVVCHCTQCQTQSGSAFSISMVLRADSFEITRGTPAHWSLEADSGVAKRAFYCPDCGTRLYNRNDAMPTTLNLKPGTLDDRSWFSPQMHVWTASRQPWVPLPDDLPCFEGNPPRPRTGS